MQPRFLTAAIVIAAAIPAAALAAHTAMSPVESAKLTGKAEVPKGSSSGSGIVVLHLDAKKGTVCWVFEKVAKIDKPTAAHIHKGKAGVAGPVAVALGAAYKVNRNVTLLGREIWASRVTDRKSTRLNSSHSDRSRMPSSA